MQIIEYLWKKLELMLTFCNVFAFASIMLMCIIKRCCNFLEKDRSAIGKQVQTIRDGV